LQSLHPHPAELRGSPPDLLVLHPRARRQGAASRWRIGHANPRLHRGGGLAEGRRAQDRPGGLRQAIEDDEPDRRLTLSTTVLSETIQPASTSNSGSGVVSTRAAVKPVRPRIRSAPRGSVRSQSQVAGNRTATSWGCKKLAISREAHRPATKGNSNPDPRRRHTSPRTITTTSPWVTAAANPPPTRPGSVSCG